jgi:Tfp pilus assembly protein PilW
MIEISSASPTSPAHTARQRGFTLVEVAVSLLVTIIVLLGVLALFDFSNKLSRVQTNISDMQQSLRAAQTDAIRMIRMAGRGGLPLGTLPNGWAVAVRNNVADPSYVGDNTTPQVVPGSDVLTVRGVLSSPLYQINAGNPAAFTLAGAPTPTTGTLTINNTTPTSIPQDLTAIKDAIANNRREALLLVSQRDAGVWAVVELNPGACTVNATSVVVAFNITGDAYATSYSQFSSSGGAFPAALTTAGLVGIVEEYRFYARRAYAIPNDKTSDLTPKLSRARVYPGTELPWAGDVNSWQADIADNIFDLQVALGLDTAANDPAKPACVSGRIAADDVNCGIYESATGENDDWMYNGEAVTNALTFANADLYYIRLTTLARTDRRDKDYQAPTLVRVEDNAYNQPATTVFNSTTERMYRRRILRTVIDMRNLG